MVLPCSFSALKKRFKAIKSGLTISSFNCASQLAWRYLISISSSSLCSALSLATHFSLSNFGAAEEVSELAVAVADAEAEVVVEEAGAAKKDVMLAFALGFLMLEAARSAALRLSGVVMFFFFFDFERRFRYRKGKRITRSFRFIPLFSLFFSLFLFFFQSFNQFQNVSLSRTILWAVGKKTPFFA